MGSPETTKEVDDAGKVQARYSLILADTARAQGDFARTSRDLPNLLRRARAAFGNLAAEIGQELLPVATELVQNVFDWMIQNRREIVRFARDGIGRIVRRCPDCAATQAGRLRSALADYWSANGDRLVENFKALADAATSFAAALGTFVSQNADKLTALFQFIADNASTIRGRAWRPDCARPRQRLDRRRCRRAAHKACRPSRGACRPGAAGGAWARAMAAQSPSPSLPMDGGCGCRALAASLSFRRERREISEDVAAAANHDSGQLAAGSVQSAAPSEPRVGAGIREQLQLDAVERLGCPNSAANQAAVPGFVRNFGRWAGGASFDWRRRPTLPATYLNN